MTTRPFSYSLWFDSEAEEAARFYASLFSGSSVGDITRYGKEGFEYHGKPEGSVLTVDMKLDNLQLVLLNGGSQFRLNPSISFFVVCETSDETDKLWQKLSEGGQVLIPLERQFWSEKYGWINDRFGVSWQVSQGKISEVGQKITPSFLFTGAQYGRAEEALRFYSSLFDNSVLDGIMHYGNNQPPHREGTVMHAQFSLNGQKFMAMDGPDAHAFQFNEAFSFVIPCGSQAEIDFYWNRLTEGGEEQPCGWLKDCFGVSWQVVPVRLHEMLKSSDPKKVAAVTNAFFQMKKFDLEALERAFAAA